MANPDPIQKLLEAKRQAFVFSAYQVWAEHRGISEHWSGGITDYWKNEQVGDTHYFDIGSVTKSVLTASVLARAVDRGDVLLSDPVSKFLPQFSSLDVGKIKLVNLLSHTAGLNAWMPFHKSGEKSVTQWLQHHASSLLATPVDGQTKAVYSDVGFWILGAVIEKIWGSLAKAFEEEVRGPLRLSHVVFGPVDGRSAVATEFREARGLPLRGIVFDENAEAMGGTASHAGLFATASGLAPWARAWLDARQDRTRWLSKKTAEIFTNPAFSQSGTWALGWDTRSGTGSSSGKRFSLASYGHLGYPGASVWIDPVQDAFAILLTNRVHPSRLDERIRQFRPQFHDLLWEHWQGENDGMSRKSPGSEGDTGV